MTPQEIITDARYIINDTDATAYRQSDPEMLGYVQDCLTAIAILKESLFYTNVEYTCIADKSIQYLSFNDVTRFDSVVRIKDGNAVFMADMDVMDAFQPGWDQVTAGPCINYMKQKNDDPLQFYIYPKAPAGQVLIIQSVRKPQILTSLTDQITDVPFAYKTALVNYVVSRAESKDDEHVNSGRAAAFYTLFEQAFTA